VPLDALSLEAPEAGAEPVTELLGDRWRVETRATLTELQTESPEPTGTALVALGGVSFNVPAVALSAKEVASIAGGAPGGEVASIEAGASGEDGVSSAKAAPGGPVASVHEIATRQEASSGSKAKPILAAGILRGTAWERGFPPLTYTAEEARGIGALYREIYEGERPVLVLEKRKASRAALEELAPKARFLHIATHGWFAPESIRSWSDPEPLDEKSGLGRRMTGEEQVKGLSPMLLCGLALAGANLPENAVGRAPGLVTADELSTLDLSNCELVVLSACDTNVGERRAGQGVASLQKALQMAGARSVITSLWKVPDEATKDLMLDFYRRLWVEKKPKHQALWEAKRRLREAIDERGLPKYTTRDWAAWVLTGKPD
jgi:CHAT domain-containing protein